LANPITVVIVIALGQLDLTDEPGAVGLGSCVDLDLAADSDVALDLRPRADGDLLPGDGPDVAVNRLNRAKDFLLSGRIRAAVVVIVIIVASKLDLPSEERAIGLWGCVDLVQAAHDNGVLDLGGRGHDDLLPGDGPDVAVHGLNRAEE